MAAVLSGAVAAGGGKASKRAALDVAEDLHTVVYLLLTGAVGSSCQSTDGVNGFEAARAGLANRQNPRLRRGEAKSVGLLRCRHLRVGPEEVQQRVRPSWEREVWDVARAVQSPMLDGHPRRTARVGGHRRVRPRAVARQVEWLPGRALSRATVSFRPEGERRVGRGIRTQKASRAARVVHEKVRGPVDSEHRHGAHRVTGAGVNGCGEADDGSDAVAALARKAVGHESAIGVPHDKNAARIRAKGGDHILQHRGEVGHVIRSIGHEAAAGVPIKSAPRVFGPVRLDQEEAPSVDGRVQVEVPRLGLAIARIAVKQ